MVGRAAGLSASRLGGGRLQVGSVLGFSAYPLCVISQFAWVQPYYLARWISKRLYALLIRIFAQRQCRSSDNKETIRTQLRYHPSVLADATIFPALFLNSNITLSSCTLMMTIPKLAPVYELPIR